ncbi:MAG: M20/M25/M40 family metallo-hydrolase [Acidobacteriota bacterium]
MKHLYRPKVVILAAFLFLFVNFSHAQTASRAAKVDQTTVSKDSLIEERNVRAEMGFLASDALQGRGSGTQFEWLAAQYIGSQLQQFGVEPAGETDASGNKTYLQTVNVTRNTFAANPTLTYKIKDSSVILEHGKDLLIFRMNAAQIGGNLQKVTSSDTKPKAGAIIFVKFDESADTAKIIQNPQKFLDEGASAVIIEMPLPPEQWKNLAARPISFTTISGGADKKTNPSSLIAVSKDAAEKLAQIADGTPIKIKGELNPPKTLQTWNAVGEIKGTDARLATEVILLSAHLDHLGVRENAPGDDKIFNGADDDASGCIAVMELARVLGKGARPKRTVQFAFFGSEEAGGFGAQYFVGNLPYPKDHLVANLEFEMIGRPDEKVAADELWLTGYERSNLGAELAKRGAKLVNDPHPEQNFFQRSDNYTLARQGVIAHTVSSFGLHTDYHHASDEIKTIDFKHMTRAINSMVEPVIWLVNSDFKPVWFEGMKP